METETLLGPPGAAFGVGATDLKLKLFLSVLLLTITA